ncbi:flaEY [Symbiodinium natans]|uniref:FlaEY protein n=1 Tax=Symbiodinium natans TaxID=878477 RepID=A0A812I7S8_9DINO|nr:flaEY [Symbiodinium natans]
MRQENFYKGSDWDNVYAFQAGVGPRSRAAPFTVDQDNNLVIAGATEGFLDGYTNAGDSDIFLMKFTSNGTWLWTVQRGSAYEGVEDLQAGGGAARHLCRFQVGFERFFLFAMPSMLALTAGSPLQVDQDNNLVVAGEGYASLDGNTHAGSADVFLMKFTSNGTWLWTVQRGSGYDATQALQASLQVPGRFERFFLLAMPSMLALTGLRENWVKKGPAGSPLQVDQDNNLVVAGFTFSSLENYTNAGSADAFFMTFTSNGAWLCTVQRGGSRAVFLQAPSELLHFAAFQERLVQTSSGPGQGVARLQKVPSLVWVWEEAGRLHPPQQVDRDNNVVAAGTTTSSLDNYTNAGVNDVFLMSLEALLQYFLAVGVVPPAGGFMFLCLAGLRFGGPLALR